MKKKFLIVGNGGRESSFAKKLAEDSVLYAVMSHENPTIIDFIKETGGEFTIGNINDGSFIADYALKHSIDYAFINSDEPLANGVVDVLLNAGIKAVGPTKEGARIEWDKIYSIEIMQKLLPEFTPFYKTISLVDEISTAISAFEMKGIDIVVKPQGLTGGKGVKVMGEHLNNYEDVTNYIIQLLNNNPGEEVLLVEKLDGIEFTIMAITDGENTVFSPASYDYPYRFENDQGPGTGGMGCFTDKAKPLPFMSESEFDDCALIMDTVIKYIREQGLHFNGVMNGGFFLTSAGIKFMEFNGRFGDPEGINILSILDSSFSLVLEKIYETRLSQEDVKFASKTSVVKYLVSPDYPHKGKQIIFKFPTQELKEEGLTISFASAAASNKEKNEYKTVSASRVVAISCTAETIVEASDKINQCIDKYFDGGLEYRADIGTQKELDKLNQRAALMNSEPLPSQDETSESFLEITPIQKLNG